MARRRPFDRPPDVVAVNEDRELVEIWYRRTKEEEELTAHLPQAAAQTPAHCGNFRPRRKR